MFDRFSPEEFWLNVTNLVLGLITVVCLAIVGRVAFKEIYARVAAKRSRIPLEEDSHAFDLADLGITMADGGVRVDEAKYKARLDQEEFPDPDNIVRSNN
jgi:hypothetical protein